MSDLLLPSPARRQFGWQMAGCLAAMAGTTARAADPDRLPDVALRTAAGLPIFGESERWRATYLDFWASWCGPCKWSFPWMNDMHDRWSAAGLRVIAINLDRREADAAQFLQQTPVRFELARDADGALATRLEVKAMPTAFLVMPDRRIVMRHRGFRLEDRADLERRIKAALA